MESLGDIGKRGRLPTHTAGARVRVSAETLGIGSLEKLSIRLIQEKLILDAARLISDYVRAGP